MAEKTMAEGLTRRAFLKSTGAALGAASTCGMLGALAGCAPQVPAEKNEEGEGLSATGSETLHFAGSCRGNCNQGCFLDLHVRDGKLVRVTNGEFLDPQYNRICFKGMSLPQRVYNPDRIKYPMRRVGERGSGEWERISWDEAIQIITDKWKADIEKYGNQSIGWYTAAGNSGVALTIALGRLQGLIGGVQIAYDVDNEFNKGMLESLGRFKKVFNGNDPSDYVNAKTIIFIGSNFTDSRYQEWHWVHEAQEKGCKLIVVDPKFSGTAAKADIWVPIRPATDSILFMAMGNIIIEKGWTDEEFLKTNTVGPFLVKEADQTFLRKSDLDATVGEEDDDLIVIDAATKKPVASKECADPMLTGTYEVEGFKVTTGYDLYVEAIAPYTKEYAAEACNVPVEMIDEITEVYCANTPSSLYQGLGHEHRQNAHKAYLASNALAMLTGNIGKSGASAGFYRPRGTYNVPDILPVEGSEPIGELVEISSSEMVKFFETGDYAGEKIPLKNLLVMSGDWFHTHGNRQALIKAIDSLEMLVVIDFQMNDTTRYADILLPCTDWFEELDVQGWKTLYPFLLMQDKAIDPLYEAKSDCEIAKLLIHAMGYPEWWDWTQEEMLEAAYGTEMWNDLKENKCVWAPYHVENDYHYIYGEDGVWGTDTTKLNLYVEKPIRGGSDAIPCKENDLGWQHVPGFLPPHEAWNQAAAGFEKNPLADKYPLSLMQEHAKYGTQTQFSHVPNIRELDPEPSVFISPADAEARGIEEGDEVRVFNDRGETVVRARIHNGMPQGLASMPNGFTADQYISGSICDVMNDEDSAACPNFNINDQLVEIEKH